VPQDYTTAIMWYWKAAEQDNALAQFNLGQFEVPSVFRLPRGGFHATSFSSR